MAVLCGVGEVLFLFKVAGVFRTLEKLLVFQGTLALLLPLTSRRFRFRPFNLTSIHSSLYHDVEVVLGLRMNYGGVAR